MTTLVTSHCGVWCWLPWRMITRVLGGELQLGPNSLDHFPSMLQIRSNPAAPHFPAPRASNQVVDLRSIQMDHHVVLYSQPLRFVGREREPRRHWKLRPCHPSALLGARARQNRHPLRTTLVKRRAAVLGNLDDQGLLEITYARRGSVDRADETPSRPVGQPELPVISSLQILSNPAARHFPRRSPNMCNGAVIASPDEQRS